MRSYVDAKAVRTSESLNSPEARVERGKCPICPGDLDTGWECASCGYDALPLAHPTPGDSPCK